MSTTTQQQVFTAAGARELDRVAAAEAAARAGRAQAETEEARALAAIRIAEAQRAAADRARDRKAARRQDDRDRAQALKQARAAQRAQAWAERALVWRGRRALLAVVPMMATSAAVALPAQYDYYRQYTADRWSAAVIAAMVEGGTWLGAALESAAQERRAPTGWYRVLTWTLAGTAAVVNVGHGLQMSWQVAVVFGLASLMGVTSWTAYMHLGAHRHSDRTADEIRTVLLRRVRYPRLSWRAASLRLAAVPVLSPQDAWVQVWAEHHAPRPARVPWRGRRAPLDPAPVAVVLVPASLDPVSVDEPVEPVEVDPPTVGLDPDGVQVRVESTPLPAPLDLLGLVAGLPALEPVALQEATEPVRVPVRVESVEARPAVPVWIEAPALDPVEVDPLDLIDPVTEELLTELDDAIEAGDLDQDPSVEAVRKALGIAWRTARDLLEERETRARTAAAA